MEISIAQTCSPAQKSLAIPLVSMEWVLYFLLNGDLDQTAESGCSGREVPLADDVNRSTPELLKNLSLPPLFGRTTPSLFNISVELFSFTSPLPSPSFSILNAGLSTPLSAVVDEFGVELK